MKFVGAFLLSASLVAGGGALAAEQPPPAHPESPLLAAPRAISPQPPSADADAAAYAHCLKQAEDDPAAARKFAEGWIKRGGAHPAEHCLDVALVGLGQYKEAAGRLEKLAGAMIQAPASLRAGVFDQAAQAWLMAGDAPHAYAMENSALSLRPDDANLLVDRAEAAGAAGWFDKAILDLDRVLKTDPSRIDALIYSASAYRQEGQIAPAFTDIEAAVKAAPDSVPALLERGNILRLRNDTDGARRDWERVAALAPGSAAAAAAKANLERLQALPPPIPDKAPAAPH